MPDVERFREQLSKCTGVEGWQYREWRISNHSKNSGIADMREDASMCMEEGESVSECVGVLHTSTMHINQRALPQSNQSITQTSLMPIHGPSPHTHFRVPGPCCDRNRQSVRP